MIYRRTFDPASGDSLARLSRWIRPGASVLELGAAAGYFTEWLKEQGASVDVVDIDPEAGRATEPFARRVVIADLDSDGWEAALSGNGGPPRYDFIVCADVLEHVRDGARLLARLRPLLVPGGELLLSVPNVAHAAIIAGLFDDCFEYGGEGLLDPTHLRLYTWRSVGALLRDAGFRILDWDATEITPYESEFRTRVESIAPALLAALGPGTRHYAYQWLVRATPGSMDEIPVPRALEGAERVPVRLLPGATRDALTLDRQYVDFIPANGDAATLEYRFAPGDAVFRILLADRIGVVAIDALALFAGEREVWRMGAPDAARATFDAVALDEHATYALVRPDAWIEPQLSPALGARVDRVSITARWTGDWTGAAAFAALAGLSDAFVERVEAAQREIARLHTLIDVRDRALEARAAAVAERDAMLLARAAELWNVKAELREERRMGRHRQTLRGWLAVPLSRVKALFARGGPR
jgi:2-polyprenyl-3-methyl-5-hydroxy-6-metoxy-1,4-benzoquinol methylase